MRNVLLALILAATVVALMITTWRPVTWGIALLPYHDALIVALIGLPVVALVPFLQNAIAGRMEQNRSMFVAFLHAVIVAVALAGVWWNGLAGYYAVYAVLGAILVLGITHMATRGISVSTLANAATSRFSLRLPPQIWRFSGALLILTFLSPFAALFIHYRLLSEHGAEAAGWMQAAIGISLSVRAVLGTAHSVFLTPNVNRGGSPQDRMEWANNFQTMFCLIAGLALPPLLLFPDIAIHVLYSSAFSPGAMFVMVFVGAEILTLLSGTYQSLVIAMNQMRFHVATNLISQLLVVGTAYLLIEPLGILGAGMAALVAPVFMYISTMTFLHRSFGIRMPGRVAARSGWLLVCVVAAGSGGVLFQGASWESLFVKAAVYLMVVAGFALLLTAGERRQIRQTIMGWKARWD
jgi:O-antigen/teichoic acid export membrane protein